MAADVEMDADFDGTSLNVSLMFLSGVFCALIGQFMTSTEEAQEDGDDMRCTTFTLMCLTRPQCHYKWPCVSQ